MKPAFGFASALLGLMVLLPSPVRAQGAIIETLDDLLNRPDAPAFRGTLPARIDLTATLPAPGNQGPTGSCTSWAITYAAGSQAARRAGLGASIKLSPAFTYNKVSGDRRCVAGTTASSTLDLLRDVGALPIEIHLRRLGGRPPTDRELQRAAYRIRAGQTDATHVEVKAQLARCAGAFAIRTSKSFTSSGDTIFDPPGVLNGEDTPSRSDTTDARGLRIQIPGEEHLAMAVTPGSYDFWVNTHVGFGID